MFRRAIGGFLKPHLRRLASSSVNGARRNDKAYPGAFAWSGSVFAAYILWYTNTRVVCNDTASPEVALSKASQELSTLLPGGNAGDSEDLRAAVWGSNRCYLLLTRLKPTLTHCSSSSKTLIPDALETIRTPSIAKWLDGVALQDLAIHQHHAACVDGRGDVYQWGSGFSGSDPGTQLKPTLTLRNKVSDFVGPFPSNLPTAKVEHHTAETDRRTIIRTFGIWKGIRAGDGRQKAKSDCKRFYAKFVVESWLVLGRRRDNRLCRDHTKGSPCMGRKV